MNIQHLWAPWRLEYLRGEKKTGCPFCELPKEAPSVKNLVLYVDNSIFVVMNKFPYNPGHLLVLPIKHGADPTSIEAAVWLRMSAALREVQNILVRDMNPQGFNVGMNVGAAGGAGIPGHLHWHVVPRWDGDTNFMPVIAETKALPTHNATVFERLKPLFEDFASRLDYR